ncbi:MAG: dipeptidase [Geminicoccaceae bacterium]|nr:dipeptidase [Geminicoccaceae bacterium]MDW8341124.1 dipeptidase [Geminicoccaceae bacterium]
MSDLAVEPVLGFLERNFDASVARLCDLLRIPSVGTDPAFAEDTRRAALWLVERLRAIGLRAELRPTAGMPIVVAHDPDAPRGAPHLLYYGHYDVQPPDPLAEWVDPPFAPVIREGPHGKRVVARGAVDDKGQLMTWLEAIAAWKAVHGRLPVRVSVLVEGEEESASANLEPFLRANAEELRADVCVISDTGMLGVDEPAITIMLRGIAYCELRVRGPSRDLHSGMYGGAAPNPIHALCRFLAALHDEEGRIALPGFYARVVEPEPEIRAQWTRIPFDEKGFLESAGLARAVGEAGRSTLERLWARPSCDVNGIWGGYTGEGSKTVIPARAAAKLSFRLVPDQDPQEVVEQLRAFLAARIPPDYHWELVPMGTGRPIRVPADSSFVAAARRALARVFGKEPALVGCGGSIPVVATIKERLGMDSLLLGFGLDDDRPHGPNEKFELLCYLRGQLAHAALLAEAARARA